MLLDLRVSADRAVWHPPHAGGKPGLFQERRRNLERDGLSAGGNRIRTIGPARVKGLSAVADERCRTDKLDGVIKRRSSRETTMVGRGASLDGRLFLGGTDGSNPVPSSGESANHQFLSGGAYHCGRLKCRRVALMSEKSMRLGERGS